MDAIGFDVLLWAVIAKRYATLHELRTVYDMDDFADMLTSIAYQNVLEMRANKDG